MAYLTGTVFQAANTVQLWDITAGGATVFDTVEAGLTAGAGPIAVTRHEVRPGPVHRLTVQVGGNAVNIRFRGGLQV